MAKEKTATDSTVKITFLSSVKGHAYTAPNTYEVSEKVAKKYVDDLGIAVKSTKVLPVDMPVRERLIAAGLETVSDVEKAKESKGGLKIEMTQAEAASLDAWLKHRNRDSKK